MTSRLQQGAALLFFFTLLATFSNRGFADFGFYPETALPQNFPFSPSQMQTLKNASVQFWATGSMNSPQTLTSPGCSAQFISSEGHLLTALHCLRTLLNADSSPLKFKLRGDGDGLGQWLEVDQQRPDANIYLPNASMRGEAGWKPLGPLRIVYAGKGFLSDYPSLSSEKGFESGSSNLLEMRAGMDDFVILQAKSLGKTPCVPLSGEASHAGEPLWSVGFPNAIRRNSNLSSDGNQRYFASGKMISSWKEYSDFSDYSAEAITALDFFHHSGPVCTTTIDSASGSSGSMVVDREAKLRGIVVGSYQAGVPIEMAFAEPITIVVQAKSMFEQLLGDLGSEEARAVFHCENPHF
ncbi:trypsin-like peptidase domain-containing protein [Bdellovibrionota bacterium FG-1]